MSDVYQDLLADLFHSELIYARIQRFLIALTLCEISTISVFNLESLCFTPVCITCHISLIHLTFRIPFKSSLRLLAVCRHQQCERQSSL